MVTGIEGGGDGDGNGVRKRGCTLSKQDFLPEESFRSWGNYVKALGSTKTRLKDRLLTRSLDPLELQDMRARSQHEMKKTLNWWDLIWFAIGAIMGAGIFVLTGEERRQPCGGDFVPHIRRIGTALGAMLHRVRG